MFKLKEKYKEPKLFGAMVMLANFKHQSKDNTFFDDTVPLNYSVSLSFEQEKFKEVVIPWIKQYCTAKRYWEPSIEIIDETNAKITLTRNDNFKY